MLATFEKKNLALDSHIRSKYNLTNEEPSQKQLKKERDHLKDKQLTCDECGKHFGHHRILHLHLQVHQASNKPMKRVQPINSVDTPSPANAKAQVSNSKTAFYTIHHEESKQYYNSSPVKKVAGLTKLRLEDYRRCDACSCIYLDESDYHKHMKNFHNQDAAKKKRRCRIARKKECRSCCKNCKCDGSHQQVPQRLWDDQTYTLHCNIKDRWSKLMEGTKTSITASDSPPEIKTEPVDEAEETLDYSHLLSQVEVRIKTEPVDELEYNSQSGE